MLSIYSNIYLSRSYRLFVQFWAFDFSHDKINGIFSKWFELMSYITNRTSNESFYNHEQVLSEVRAKD